MNSDEELRELALLSLKNDDSRKYLALVMDGKKVLALLDRIDEAVREAARLELRIQEHEAAQVAWSAKRPVLKV